MTTTLLVLLVVLSGDTPLKHVWVEVEGAKCAEVLPADPNYSGPGVCYWEEKVTDSRGVYGVELDRGRHRVTIFDSAINRNILFDEEIDFQQEKEPYVVQTESR